MLTSNCVARRQSAQVYGRRTLRTMQCATAPPFAGSHCKAACLPRRRSAATRPCQLPSPCPRLTLEVFFGASFRTRHGSIVTWRAFCTAFHKKLPRPSKFRALCRLHHIRPSGVGGGAVEKRSFVVKELRFIRPLRCVKCGGNAHLTRRSPDPVKKDGSEIRIFECHECGHQTERTAKG